MPKVDVRTVREEKIKPGTMTEILVHANMGYEGVSLISPVWNLDNRCIYPGAISLMTTQPLQEEVNWPMTEKQRQINKKGHRYATYAVYNTSHETIILPKNQIVGRCQLILQPNEGAYLQEMLAMQREGVAKKEVEEQSRKGYVDADSEENQEELPREMGDRKFPTSR